MTVLTIWCDDGTPPADLGPLVLWNAFVPDGSPQTWHSLPDEVHARRDELRAAYLRWTHDIGASRHRGSTVVEALRIRPHLSYWWMTLPADFSLGPDSPVYAAVRMMALEQLADRRDVTSVRVVASDRETREALVDWARETGREVTTIAGPDVPTASGASSAGRARAYRAAPPLAALRVLLAHLPLARRSPPSGPRQGGITVVDYLAHLAKPADDPDAFASNYWGPLVSLLDQRVGDGEPVTYLHLSADPASAAVIDRDSEHVHRLGAASPGPAHELLHSRVSWRVLRRSVRDYARVVRFGLATRHAGTTASTDQPVALWRLFNRARRDQFYGASAMLNCLWINVFEATLRDLPRQRLGVYLMENQPWEMAFTSLWRQFGHGRLIGVIHSTALFWSTRLYRDPRDCWSSEGACPMPWPDAVAVNGPAMRATCARAGYPTGRMVDAEALRYLHLLSAPSRAAATTPPTVLVLGEYGADVTRRLLDLVTRAVDLADRPLTVVLRPHPAAAPVDVARHPGITLDHHDTLGAALDDATIAVCGAISSAAVDAASRGLTTVLVSDASTFFTSPAEDLPGTATVRTPDDLAAVLRGASDTEAPAASASVFLLDAGVPRWRDLVSGSSSPL